MTDSAPLVLFGGTFDPVHRAHISCARTLSRCLGDVPVSLMPNAVPPHRSQPGASAAQRLAMLALAVADHPLLQVDDRELTRSGPSWTVDTLAALRQETPTRPLVLAIGADSLASFHHWHRWEDYPSLCHLAVFPRPGAPAPAEAVAQAFPTADAQALSTSVAGLRLMLTSPCLDVSATAVRRALAEKGTCVAVPEPVLAYIRRHGLYNIGTNSPSGGTPPETNGPVDHEQ